MKQSLKKITAALLAAALLLCGCTTSPDASSSETTSAHAAASAAYATAIQDVLSWTDVVINTVSTQSITTAGVTYTIDTTEKLTYLGLGTDGFAALADCSVDYGNYTSDRTERFVGGTVYASIADSDFSAAITAEEFTARYTPLNIIDPALYTNGGQTGSTITFADAVQPEAWLRGEDVTVQSATATAYLDSNGKLEKAEHKTTYVYGSATITRTTTQTVTQAANATPITAPAKADTFQAVSSIDALLILEQSYGMLHQAEQLTASLHDLVYTQAAAYVASSSTYIDSYGSGDEQIMRVELSYEDINHATSSTFSQDQVETFRDGKYTVETDGGRPVTDGSITIGDMRDHYMTILLENILELSYLKDATCTDLGSVYLAEYTGTDALSESYNSQICYDLFGDEKLLDNMASAYKTNKLEYFVAIDKFTGLPTAIGLDYEGAHTIEGMEYLLMQQVNCALDLASMRAYHTITDELPPDTEPENKPTPLFYHVTGSNGQEMWLLGTIHVGDDRTGFLPQPIYDALSVSDALALECDLEEFEKQVERDEQLQEAIADAYFYTEGTAKDHVTDSELYDTAVKLMKATGNYSANIDTLKISLWSQSIENFYLQQGGKLSSDKGLETRLTKFAQDNRIPIREVESAMDQLRMTCNYSDGLQEMLLQGSVELRVQEYWEGTEALYELWCAGDEASLIKEITEEPEEDFTEEEKKLYDEYTKAMDTDRNAGMLNVAKEYLESGETVFYAVGLAHVLAKDGLVNTLRDAGYTVELVTYP